MNIDYLWIMGLWQTGKKSIEVSRNYQPLQNEYRTALPDLKESDIAGSPYAIAGYQPAKIFGPIRSLHNFRRRLNKAGIKLILDFIPNHTGLDHSWLHSNPGYYMHNSDTGMYYQEYFEMTGLNIAHGKDPYFPPWTDTLQLDYTNSELRQKQIDTLLRLAEVCDGVRCDMAMLVTNEVFYKTWNRKPDNEFWPDAISSIKTEYPDFLFLAEVYWEMEWQLQQMGFDFTYDKRLYDRLHSANAREISAHLQADVNFQNKSIRFIENHDEPRAVSQFGPEKSLAAATVIYTIPGMRFLHHGQTQGYRIKIPVQLNHMPQEIENKKIYTYYKLLLNITSKEVFKKGQWQLESCDDHRLLYWTWRLDKTCMIVVINYSDQTVETNIPLPVDYPIYSDIEFKDNLTARSYLYHKVHLRTHGLYIKLAPYQSHILHLKSLHAAATG
jgi:glycosidase